MYLYVSGCAIYPTKSIQIETGFCPLRYREVWIRTSIESDKHCPLLIVTFDLETLVHVRYTLSYDGEHL